MAAKVNPDLQKERDTASFNTEQLTHILDGGEKRTKRRRYIEGLVLNDPEITGGTNYHFMDRSEKYSNGMRKAVYMIKKIRELGLSDQADLYWFRSKFFPNEAGPLGLHTSMFLPTLFGQSSEEQQAKWLPLALSMRMLGTYAQTEMGHGTFLRGLETTATYDAKTEEFIINSPTLTSAKWWPGGLGKTSNHAVVMAVLHINGTNHGTHPFLVQLRDLDTHEPLPGVTIGDIGPKFGYDSIDNGFLSFNNIRIPRFNMLAKNSQVAPDGTYTKPKHAKLSYGTMIFVRAMISSDVAAKPLAQALAIAIRYSCVRHQSEMKPGAPEPQIIEYQTQQYKLFPLLATAYALWFSGKYIGDMYFRINSEIQAGNVDLLPELHALSAGLKAFSTFLATAGIEQCRLACGGHGYSQASGIPKIYVNATPGVTYEGENTVMLLQTARYLIKCYNQAKAGGKLSGTVSYLADPVTSRSNLNGALDLQSLLEAYKHRAIRLVAQCATKMQRLQNAGKPQYEAWNLTSVELTKASMAHMHYFVLNTFVGVLQRRDIASPVLKVLTTLCRLFAVHGISEGSGEFIQDGFVSSDQLDLANASVLDLMAEVRPNAVALVDSFDFHDHLLGSVLGRYDGNVYENMFKWAKESPLNKTEVHESYYKYLRPMMEASKSKL